MWDHRSYIIIIIIKYLKLCYLKIVNNCLKFFPLYLRQDTIDDPNKSTIDDKSIRSILQVRKCMTEGRRLSYWTLKNKTEIRLRATGSFFCRVGIRKENKRQSEVTLSWRTLGKSRLEALLVCDSDVGTSVIYVGCSLIAPAGKLLRKSTVRWNTVRTLNMSSSILLI